MSGKLVAWKIQHLVKYTTSNYKVSSYYMPYNSCTWYIPNPLQLQHLCTSALLQLLVYWLLKLQHLLHQQHVKAIIDPGSQIITIAEEVCIDLGLIYDPTIILNMQLANGEVDKSLGLARNVPLRIGEIILYVQIHVIHSPAYDILLSRPFNILTESVVRNFANEDQTITIFNPNSGRCATVPTSPCGRPRRLLNKPSFLTSRI